MMKRTSRILCAFILVLAFAGSLRAAPVFAASFTVNTSTDASDSNTADGICDNGVDGCSLRAAIEQAFTVSSAGSPLTITFWSGIAGSTLPLSLESINWAADYVTLDGAGSNITISGAGLGSVPSIFTITGSHNVINLLTIRDSPWDGVQMGDFAGVGAGNYNSVANSILLGNGAAGVYVHGSASGGGQGNTISGNLIGLTNIYAAGCAAGEGNRGDGIYIDANASATSIVVNYITCSTYNGIYINGTGGAPTGTVINNNYVGLNVTGATPNYDQGIFDWQSVNTSISGNTISGNAHAGVWLLASSGAKLTNNWIGTDMSGHAAIPNGIDGVAVTDGAANSMVGGIEPSSPLDRNVISGNTECGVRIRDGAIHTVVDFNFIGLDVTGTSAIPNGTAGVCIFNANDNQVGSSTSGVSQFISGNTREGIYIENSSDTIVGSTNRIGVAMDGTSPRGNGLQGIMLYNASNNYLQPGSVSYNGAAGVAVVGETATGNAIFFYSAHSNAGLPIDLGNDGASPNGSHAPPGPNNWQAYPVITGSSGSPVMLTGSTCANCRVLIFRAIGNPAANGGGGTYLSQATANAAGVWSATLPAGLARHDVSLVAQKTPMADAVDTSEMSALINLFLPFLRR
jgi:CSLREA domain-containing protein